jgi:hypothetical protein
MRCCVVPMMRSFAADSAVDRIRDVVDAVALVRPNEIAASARSVGRERTAADLRLPTACIPVQNLIGPLAGRQSIAGHRRRCWPQDTIQLSDLDGADWQPAVDLSLGLSAGHHIGADMDLSLYPLTRQVPVSCTIRSLMTTRHILAL